jgi:3-methyladenine DNA glycosylase AlkD
LGLKRNFLTENPAKAWARIGKYLDSPDAWAVRIGLNLVFANFLNDENIERVLAEITKIDARYREKAPRGTLNYYVKMMLAWTLAEAAINYQEKVEVILPKLDQETAKYTRQKMRDSRRV